MNVHLRFVEGGFQGAVVDVALVAVVVVSDVVVLLGLCDPTREVVVVLDELPVPAVVDGLWAVVEVEVDSWGAVVVDRSVARLEGTTDTDTAAGGVDRTSR